MANTRSMKFDACGKMKLQANIPKQLSLWLALITSAALLVILGALFFIAFSLAREFNASAQRDTLSRVEQGLEAAVTRLNKITSDYSNWNDHYLAVRRRDGEWLYENVGTSAQTGGIVELIILTGGPLDKLYAWSAGNGHQFNAKEYRDISDLAESLFDPAVYRIGSPPLPVTHWVGDKLWMFAIAPIVPHTESIELLQPLALQIFGLPLDAKALGHFDEIMQTSDFTVSTVPGDPRASLAVEISDGSTVWLTWTPTQPGTAAIKTVAVPISVALILIVLVHAASAMGVRLVARQLVFARINAEAANAAKSQFLAHMSHEIRTPLNGVLGMAELLADTPLKEDQRELLKTIQNSGALLLLHVNAILDLARVEAGKLSLECIPFSMSSILDRLEIVHGSISKSKGIILQVQCQSGLADHRLGDPIRLEQILHNILGNAIKFTESGRVVMNVSAHGASGLTFCVTDTGIGMTEGQLARVFDSFEQADVGTTRRYGGSGLGMSIVNGLVRLMGGSIAVTSEIGKGTAVTVTLPLAPTKLAPVTADSDDYVRIAVAPEIAMHKGIRLLVVDDNETNRKIVGLMLKKMGFVAEFAANGAKACELWEAEPFDLVFMDISMPVMDGIVALETMKRTATETGRLTPVAIALTANVMKEQVESYLVAGFAGVLPKPIRFSELQDSIARHLPPSIVQGDTEVV